MVDFINIQVDKDYLLYDDRVKNYYANKGIIRLKKEAENVYVIFPIYRKDKGNDVIIAIDEVLNRDVSVGKDDVLKIDMEQEYVGRRCVVINADQPINVNIRKREVIYDGKVKSTYNGQGLVRLKNGYLGKRAYVLFPKDYKEVEGNLFLSINEIHNKGIHSNNDHTCRVLLNRDYIGDDCFIILQEG